MNELALFAGAGGGILGGKLLGWRTVCAVEWEPYPASVLVARQNDGVLPPFPIWDDVQTFDGKPWRGCVDVVSGGFPCQDISAAGKGTGIDGERSGMWREMARIIHEVRPRYAFVENSPMLTSRGLGTVLGDLASMGFDARWGVLGAADVGANHQRDRIWIVAKWRGQLSHAQHERIGRWEQQQAGAQKEDAKLADAMCDRLQGIRADGAVTGSTGLRCGEGRDQEQDLQLADTENQGYVWRDWFMGASEEEHDHRGSQTDGGWQWWATEPDVGRVANGVAARVDRLKAIGNGQVPLCAATAWRVLSGF
jgi:DNA (cytosine-5)-methyltransferase 1